MAWVNGAAPPRAAVGACAGPRSCPALAGRSVSPARSRRWRGWVTGRLAPRQRPGERAQIGAQAAGKAQDRAARRPSRSAIAARSSARTGSRVRPPRSASARARRRRGRSASSRSRGRPRRSAGCRSRPPSAHDDFVVEAPQILERAAAARDDQHVGTRIGPARRQRVETVDRRRDFLRPRSRPARAPARREREPETGRRGGAGCRG